MLKHYLTLLLITIIMISALTYAYMNGGNPSFIRDQKLDEKLTQNIQSTKFAVDDYVYINKQLPSSMVEIKSTNYFKNTPNSENITDQITYKLTSKNTYSLCSTFKTDNHEFESAYDYTHMKHPTGYFCFDYTIDSIQQPQSQLQSDIQLRTPPSNLATPSSTIP